ncbi:DUF3987 domain-containing protein [Burkholderia sp. L27(2015)]|uniref:DUF3987 domain-containing protein n=1 Tax=Burkholderia sp. L27(2015) TaxID=1641858 RepID=UPI00131D2DF5|nr:DUF3987 domain-containing protein [Burkholderia sp. L27(2015)]
MHYPVNPFGGGFMPSQTPVANPRFGYGPTLTSQAINALTPTLFRAAIEQRAIFGSTEEAILANLLGATSFAAAGNSRIRGHNGKPMLLGLHIRFVGPPLSGKTDAHDRSNNPIDEGMRGWKKTWRFSNVRPPTLIRKIRGGAVFSMLSMSEGRAHLGDPLSFEFALLSDLYDGQVPAFSRADDDDDAVANAPDSAIFVKCVNVQSDRHREWLKKHGEEATGSGYQYRELVLETDQRAVEGVGRQQPEVALLEYDRRIGELIASARRKLEAMSASQLPVIDVPLESEQILRQALEHFRGMARLFLPLNEVEVFAVRLAANTRRIAGCMHVFEGYEGGVSADTMVRAVTIAECFGAHWLASVFPPKPIPEAVQRAQHLLDSLRAWARQAGVQFPSWKKSDIEVWAPNFGWTRAEMNEAIMWICEQGFAQVVPRTEKGRRVVKLELIAPNIFPLVGLGYKPMKGGV